MPLGSSSLQERWRIGAERGLTGTLQELLCNGGSFSGRERGCCFLNLGDGKFGDVSAVSGLDFPDDGRAAVPLDWDHDGDLDLCVLNRSGPQIRFLRNQYRGRNSSVMIRLQGTESNRDAIGARLTMTVRHEEKTHQIIRTLRAGDGYLSQRSKWLHFGLSAGQQVEGLSIRWPSGNFQDIAALEVGKRYVIQEMKLPSALPAARQNVASKSVARSPTSVAPAGAAPSGVAPAGATARGQSRTMLASPMPIPAWDGRKTGAARATPRNERTLLTLWSVDCLPCRRELKELAAGTAALEKLSLKIQPLCTDDRQKTLKQAGGILRDLGWKQAPRIASARLLDQLQLIHDEVFDLHDPLPLPCSFLIDEQGRLSVIYKGALDLEQLLRDVKSVGLPPTERRDLAGEFKGKWSGPVQNHSLSSLALAMLAEGWVKETVEYSSRFRRAFEADSSYYALLYGLGQQLTRESQHREAAELYLRSVQQKPDFASGHFNLGLTLRLLGDMKSAATHFALAAESEPNDHRTRLELGKILMRMGRVQESTAPLTRALELESDHAPTHFEFALNCALRGDIEIGIEHLKQAALLQPRPFADANFRKQFRAGSQIGLDRLRKQGRAVEQLERLLEEME